MMHFTRRMVLLLLALTVAGSHAADTEPGKDAAVAMVKSAVAFMKSNGREATLRALGEQGGEFRNGQLFVVAVDPTGKVLGHTGMKKMIGANIMELRDVNGVYMVKDIFEKAKKASSGWSVEYMFVNPDTQKMAPKITYFEKVDDLILFCGIYK